MPLVGLTGLACLIVTAAIQLADPALALNDDLREGQLEAAAAIVMTVASGVLFGRFRRECSWRNLLLPAALLVLAGANLFATIATPLADSLSTRRFATWTAAGFSALGALMLAGAAVLPDRTVLRRGHAVTLVLGASGLGLLVVGASTALLGDRLPAAFETLPNTAEDLVPFREHPALLAIEGVTAAAYAVAAVRLGRITDRDGGELSRWLSVGAVFSAAAFINYALFPSQFTELLYTGDLFFLIAVGVLLYGAIVDSTGTEAALVRSAVSSERQRVAGELRAGVAQELAFMASQTEWFAHRPAENHSLEKLAESVERALDESQGAIAALVRPADEPVAMAVGHAALEVGGRIGARIELDLDQDVVVDRECREALVRLTRESVAIAVRQGKARTVWVELRKGRPIILRIADDGEGLDLATLPSTHRLGLQALRERAESLGATFTYTPRAGTGSTVEVVLR